MSWSGIASNQCVSRNNLQDAVNTGVFTLKNTIPAGTEQITKADADFYVNIDTSYGPYAAKASNQLVVKSNLISGSVVSYSYNVRLDETSISNVCFQPFSTVWSSSAEFTEGMTLYFDSDLTTLVTGYFYVSFLGTSEIFELNIGTGVVEFNTGLNC